MTLIKYLIIKIIHLIKEDKTKLSKIKSKIKMKCCQINYCEIQLNKLEQTNQTESN